MKLWRKLAKKTIGEDGTVKRNGRQIKQMMQQMNTKNVKVTANGSISLRPGNRSDLTLIEGLFKRAGIESPKTDQEKAEEALEAAENAEVKEDTNETV
jgi:predicted Fe-Mo cluster-binding NifX family protein